MTSRSRRIVALVAEMLPEGPLPEGVRGEVACSPALALNPQKTSVNRCFNSLRALRTLERGTHLAGREAAQGDEPGPARRLGVKDPAR